jgi:hypothetical protein
MNIKIHTKGITGSSITKKGESPGASFGAFLEIDGEIYEMVSDIKVDYNSESFATLTVTFIPGSIEVINHTEETWPKVVSDATARSHRTSIRNSEGRTIAIYVSPAPDRDIDDSAPDSPTQA